MENDVYDAIQSLSHASHDLYALSCFQQYMDKVFALLLYKNLENYLDDALNHHKTEAEHIQGIRDTLQCLQDTNLFCNAKKCEFHQKKIEFLRVDISREGFEMDDKKIMDVVQWQQPTMVWGVCEFIGFVNFYCRWIPGFSNVAKPLHALFQKDHKMNRRFSSESVRILVHIRCCSISETDRWMTPPDRIYVEINEPCGTELWDPG
jgi:hypothetical protein